MSPVVARFILSRLAGVVACAVTLAGCYFSSSLVRLGAVAAPPRTIHASSLTLGSRFSPESPGRIELVDVSLKKREPVCKDQKAQVPTVMVPISDRVFGLDLSSLSEEETKRGQRSELVITAGVRRQDTDLIVSGIVTIIPEQEGGAAFQSRYEKTVSVAHLLTQGCTYRDVNLKGNLRASKAPHSRKWSTYKGRDIIGAAKCRVDSKGDDPVKWSCRISFRPIRLKVWQ